MKKIIYFLLFSFHSLVYASADLEVLCAQQKTFHQEEHGYIREALLMDLASVIQQRSFPCQKTYMFWGGEQVKSPQIASFVELLEKDLAQLGVPILDRVHNRKALKSVQEDPSLTQAEKVLILMSYDMGLTLTSQSYLNFSTDLRQLDGRLPKEGRVDPIANILKEKSVMPLGYNGNSLGLRQWIDESDGRVLEEFKIGSKDYLNTLVHLLRFCYEIPKEDKFEKSSFQEFFSCFPQFKKTMGYTV
ncbi:MAG: hypothetical protein KBB83_03035 [Alphaproteobacteria bacterium]|nr:hypothetical protein [Alphaproteobacteria bacterium]